MQRFTIGLPGIKLVTSTAVGRVVEDRTINTVKASPKGRVSCREVLTELSPDDLIARLVKQSPKAQVNLAGISTMCILDTGAETSLISESFYKDHLAEKFSEVRSVGSYLRVYGAGCQELPIEGYIHVPLIIHGIKADAHFLVVKALPGGEAVNSNCSVLLGCNILHQLRDMVIDPEQRDAEAWAMAIQWYRLTKIPVEGEGNGNNSSVREPVSARTGRSPIHLLPREVKTLTCHIRAPIDYLSGKTVFVEKPPELSETNGIGATCRVYESCETTNGKTVNVLVANVGMQAIEIPPHTMLAVITEVSPRSDVELKTSVNGLEVSVSNVLAQLTEYKETGQPNLSESAEADIEFDKEIESGLGETFRFEDGSEYQLPRGLKLDCAGLSRDHQEQIVRLIQKHDAVFSKGPFDLGFCDRVKHKIHTTDEHPISQPYRRIPPHQLGEVREMLEKFLDQGIIKKSSSPYASPIVLVTKKDGSVRICIDYRKLNAKTIRDSFPLPRIEESLEALRGAQYFSALDLAHGYHQVAMDTESVSKTAFRVPFGLFEYTRMPFGLVNAPSTFQRVMEMCVGDLNLSELLIYLDDLLVFSPTVEEHIARLDRVLTRLADFGLKVKGAKCDLFCTQVKYLGHVVGPGGVAVDNDKIQRIKDWPVPQTAAHLRSFLGLAGYYRRFVRSFSKMAAPLHALVPSLVKGSGKFKKHTFVWSKEAQAAFDDLKGALTQAPVLSYPDFARPFVVEVDASLQGLGACLAQVDVDGKRHPVAFASRGLRGVEANYPDYSSFKLELLALKWAVVDKFRDYLLGVPFVVMTDNNPLSYLKTAKLGACEMRWVAQLAAFTFEVKFRSGISNRCADALSRYPGHASSQEVEGLMQNKTHSTVVPLRRVRAQGNSLTRDNEGNTNVLGPPGVFPSWKPEQLTALQRADPVLKFLWVRWSERWTPGEVFHAARDEPPEVKFWLWQWPRIIEQDGVLCRRVVDPVLGELVQTLMPKCLQLRAITGCHDQWGHQGVSRTCSLLRRRVYWPKMSLSVRQHIKQCKQCVMAKASEPQARVPMRHLLAFRPLEVLAIDFVKVDKGQGGYEDVLVMTDVYTKFTQAIPCKNQLAPTVAKILINQWFTKFGIPNRLHSDQGRNFEGDVVRELCALYGIKKTRTTPYHPEGNAQAERFNRTLFGLIRSIDERKRHRWPDMLPHLVFVYNTTPHCTTGIAPYTLMFGREPTIPLDQMLGRSDSDWSQNFVEEQAKLIDKAGELVKERVTKRCNQNKKAYDSKAPVRPIDNGSQVLLRRCGFKGRHKLQDKYERNPYIVTWVNEHGDVYHIRPIGGGTERIVNRKYLRLDPMAELEPECVSVESDDDSDWDMVDATTNHSVEHDQGSSSEGVGNDKVWEPPCVSEGPSLVRRSQRSTQGKHNNPHHLPCSVLK